MKLRSWPFWVIIVLYFITALVNLAYVPVAWVDETMLIDPAWQLLKHGHFSSMIWPHKGTEDVFLAYLPLSSFIHTCTLFIFPPVIFFTRMPWLLALIIAACFMYRFIDTRHHINKIGILVILILFLFDEGISNAMRSGRAEMPVLALLAAAFYLSIRRKHPYIQSLLLGLLSIAHLSVYPIIAILFAELITRKQPARTRALSLLIMIVPGIIYLGLAHFDVQLIYQQLIVHGREHDQSAVTGNPFWLHFVERFQPVYRFQAYMIILNLLIHALCVYHILVRRSFRQSVLEWCFLATSIFWFFSLAPFARYTPVLVLMIFLLLPDLYKRVLSFAGFIRINFSTFSVLHAIVMFLIIGYIAAPFAIRNISALYQRKERYEFAAYRWLDTWIKPTGQRVLIIDESIGHFYSMNREGVDFTLTYAVKKFSFKEYDEVYYLTHRSAPKGGVLIDEYLKDWEVTLPAFLPKQPVITYKGLRLYKIGDERSFEGLQRGYRD